MLLPLALILPFIPTLFTSSSFEGVKIRSGSADDENGCIIREFPDYIWNLKRQLGMWKPRQWDMVYRRWHSISLLLVKCFICAYCCVMSLVSPMLM